MAVHARRIGLTGIPRSITLLGWIRLLGIALRRHLLPRRTAALGGVIPALALGIAGRRAVISPLALRISIGLLALGNLTLGSLALMRLVSLGRVPLRRLTLGLEIALGRLTGVAAALGRIAALALGRHPLRGLLSASVLLIGWPSVIHPCPFAFPPSREKRRPGCFFSFHASRLPGSAPENAGYTLV